ncbi:hypothetical protein I2485_09530 [Nesterenkonia sp. E16_7]|uniref:hypothetical protein n=1 Tax=unclassified Nesterenkonia TaxID=2629769 RepID=UPI001A92DCC6|nr:MULTISPECIES: hypothetical protein [unclassified Nesterenkonia]MBO0595235.1 hypothetical protein [Nesterenkonia sp. E16_10]MBO0598884.1 hypothetical protein [Nesterenkonia sp. E16_7]
MTVPHQQPEHDQQPHDQQQSPEEPTLSLEELETEIAQAEALVQDLNQRLKQTAEDRR